MKKSILTCILTGVTVLAASLAPTGAARAQSTTDGIQESINSCPSSGGCEIALDCNTTYDLTSQAPDVNQLVISNKDDIWIRGCGLGSTTLLYSDDTSADVMRLVEIYETADRIKISDLKLVFDDTCTSGCDQGVNANGAVSIRGGTDLVLENVWIDIRMTAAAIDDGNRIQAVQTRAGFGGTHGLRIANSRFTVNGEGIWLRECDDCVIDENFFELNRVTDSASTAFIFKQLGKAVRISNNTFYMATDEPDPGVQGIKLQQNGSEESEYAQIWGNSFIGFPLDADVTGIQFYGYNHAIVTGNLFEAGKRCSGDIVKECEQNSDCVSPQTCDDPAANAIYFVPGRPAGSNSFNLLSGNVFEGWTTTDNGCPIRIPDDGDANEDNIISESIFDTGSTTSDSGVCASSTQKAANDIHDNLSH